MRYLGELCVRERAANIARIRLCAGGSVRTAVKSEISNVRRVFNFDTEVCANIEDGGVCLRDPSTDKRFRTVEIYKTTSGVFLSLVCTIYTTAG